MPLLENNDTIVAPLTPPGVGGVGILRLSGPLAENILLRHFFPTKGSPPLRSHQLYHGRIFDLHSSPIDEVLCVMMRKPHSYTREDVAEVHCHGGPQVLRRILDVFIDSGARMARPGEFTRRAFLNGRIDLAQAEAVMQVIHASSEGACSMAIRQLEGKLSSAIYGFRGYVVELLALVETHIDFPDEDIELPSRTLIEERLALLLSQMHHLASTFDTGRVLREGLSLLIIGKPNVGKSSLLNALLGESRAIVTDIPGTTRDTIEENLTLGGIPFRVVDTAGIRDTEDPIEREGVGRAKKLASSADVILFVVDGSHTSDQADYLAAAVCAPVRTILVVNKSDLPPAALPGELSHLPRVDVSAVYGSGIEQLKNMIVEISTPDKRGDFSESVLVSDRRHREALLRAIKSLRVFKEGLQGQVAPEFLSLELREALDALGEITGESAPDEILNQIFSRFCIGK